MSKDELIKKVQWWADHNDPNSKEDIKLLHAVRCYNAKIIDRLLDSPSEPFTVGRPIELTGKNCELSEGIESGQSLPKEK